MRQQRLELPGVETFTAHVCGIARKARVHSHAAYLTLGAALEAGWQPPPELAWLGFCSCGHSPLIHNPKCEGHTNTGRCRCKRYEAERDV